MSLVSALFTGITGLAGSGKALEVVGNNIANGNSIGFKEARPVFGDILSSILNNGSTTTQVGHGAKLIGVMSTFNQGAFETSDNAMDMAIDGAGFFVVKKNSANMYTRAGQFRLNDKGLLMTPTGEVIQGFKMTGTTAAATMTDIDLASVQSAPKASTEFTLGANLNAAASAGTTFNSPITMYNSNGTQVITTITFTKQAGANAWRYVVSPSTGTVTSGASGTATFDTTGKLSGINGATTDPTIAISYAASSPPANAQTLTWKLFTSGVSTGKLTGFASPSNNSSFVQDGFSTGTLVGLSVDVKGVIHGLFNNGQTENLFQVGMANFLAPVGLTRKGSNLFGESAESGQPILGTAETGGFGTILGSSLELSNVDLAGQFVKMIELQQAFQSSARVITTTNTLLGEAVNLTR